MIFFNIALGTLLVLLGLLGFGLGNFDGLHLASIDKSDESSIYLTFLLDNKLHCIKYNTKDSKDNGKDCSDKAKALLVKLTGADITKWEDKMVLQDAGRKLLMSFRFGNRYHEENNGLFCPLYEYKTAEEGVSRVLLSYDNIVREYSCKDGALHFKDMPRNVHYSLEAKVKENAFVSVQLNKISILFFEKIPLLKCHSASIFPLTSSINDPDVSIKDFVLQPAAEKNDYLLVESNSLNHVRFETENSMIIMDSRTCEIAERSNDSDDLVKQVKGEYVKISYSKDRKLFLLANCNTRHGGIVISSMRKSKIFYDGIVEGMILSDPHVRIGIFKGVKQHYDNGNVPSSDEIEKQLKDVQIVSQRDL